jgi:hypothetical protein
VAVVSSEDKQKLAYLAAYLLAIPWLSTSERALSPLMDAATKYAPGAAQQAFLKLYADVERKLNTLAEAIRSGKVSPDGITSAMEQILKPAYQQASTLGKVAAGRLRTLSEADTAEVMKQWDAEAKYAAKLKDDFAAGRVSDARLGQRVKMYAHAVREVYNRSWAYHKDTPLFQWHMHPGAEHCVACVAVANGNGSGLPTAFYRLNELPFFPGRSPVCLTNCMCWLEAADGDVGAPQVREPASSGDQPE